MRGNKWPHWLKGEVVVGTIIVFVFVLGGLAYYVTRQVPTFPSNTSTTDTISTKINVPPLPSFLEWQPETLQPHAVSIGSVSVSAQKWIAAEKGLSETSQSPILGRFEQYYAELKNDGWSLNHIDISVRTISGPVADGRFGHEWSYLKRSGDDLYLIVLGYDMHPAGFDTSYNGEPPFFCPCSITYEVYVSGPVPINNISDSAFTVR